MKVSFKIPGQPVAWRASKSVRTAKGARHYSPTPVHEWKARVALVAAQAMMGKPRLEGKYRPIVITVWFHLERPRSRPAKYVYPDGKPDNANLLKATEDALHGIVFRDDGQGCDTHIYKRYADPANGPYTEIVVEDMEDEV